MKSTSSLRRLASCVMLLALVPLWVADRQGARASERFIQVAAVIRKLHGKYYYQTDRFQEACGASTLVVQTGWSDNSSSWTRVYRGQPVYLTPAQGPNGSFEWHCGNVLINGRDHSECNNSPADYVRIHWAENSNDIDMQCYKVCGKGTTASECAAY